MAKHKKALARLCARPTPADLKWAELIAALGGLGFDLLKGRGARRKFVQQGTGRLIICHEPHPAPEVGKACVDDIVSKLRDWQLI